MAQVTLIAAVAEHSWVIGDGQGMPWHLPEDLKHFKATTMGHPLVIGRTTYETMGALPGRTSIVLTSRPESLAEPNSPNARVIPASTLEEALALAGAAEGGEQIFVAGGGQIYRLALERADRLLISWVEEAEPITGNVTFPRFELAPQGPWVQESSEQRGGWRLSSYRRAE